MPSRRWFSLGSDCQVAFHLKRRRLRAAILPTDWALSSTASIIGLIKSDFQSLFSPNSIRIENTGAALADSVYGLRFPHDVKRFRESGICGLQSRYRDGVDLLRRALAVGDEVILVRRKTSRAELSAISGAISTTYPKSKAVCVGIAPASDYQRVAAHWIDGTLHCRLPHAAGWMGNSKDWDCLLDLVVQRLRRVQNRPLIERILGVDWDATCASLERHSSTPLTLRDRDVLLEALVYAEDRRFWKHRGVDPLAAARALKDLLLKGTLAGASTVEQQLFRTLTGRRERTFRRKAVEWLGAVSLSRAFKKSDIGTAYLRAAYFGTEMTGLLSATSKLGINLDGVSFEQAALLVAHLKYPRPRRPPHHHDERVKARVAHITSARFRRRD